MIGKKLKRSTARLFSFGSVLLLLGLYTVLSERQQQLHPGDRTIPTWSQLWTGLEYLVEQPQEQEEQAELDLLAAALGEAALADAEKEPRNLLSDRILWEASCSTLSRLLGGLATGLVGGVLLGVLMGCFLKIDAAVSPIMYFASRIIPTAAMPIFFKLAGIEMEMYVTMIAFGSMPIVTLTVSQIVQEFPDELRYKAYTLGASHLEVILTSIFPYILPKVLDLAILMIGPALVYLIAAEQIVAGEGFGYRIRVLTKATRFEVVYPLIVILTLYASILTAALRLMQKKLCPWYKLGGR